MTNGNDAATGHAAYSQHGGCTLEYGLTKREYFAALAMQGILPHLVSGYKGNLKDIAIDAVKQADWLITVLNKENENDD